MGVHYNITNGQVTLTYVCQEASVRSGEKVCQRVPGVVVDQAITELLLELMQPITLEVAMAVQQEVELRISETDSLRRKHVERAQYEAELARRRYMNVDPETVSSRTAWKESGTTSSVPSPKRRRSTSSRHKSSAC